MPRILIVEDEQRIAGFIAKGLEQQGILTTIVSDGADALALMQNESFDGVLLDLGLPVVSGWEVMEVLQEQGDSTPIVVMTALSDGQHESRARMLGAKTYIQKPFRFEVLLQSLEACWSCDADAEVLP